MAVVRVGDDLLDGLAATGPFAVEVDDRLVRLTDLAPEHVDAIAKAAGVSWLELLTAPTVDLAAALALVNAAELAEGALPTNPTSVTALVARFVRYEPGPAASSSPNGGAG